MWEKEINLQTAASDLAQKCDESITAGGINA
jgi:hypothetical protein